MKTKKGATITAVPFIFLGSLMRVAIATSLFYKGLTRLSIDKNKGGDAQKNAVPFFALKQRNLVANYTRTSPDCQPHIATPAP